LALRTTASFPSGPEPAVVYLTQASPKILATNENKLWAADFIADLDDYPYPVPRSAHALED
jgi:hypothetical protein